MSDKIFETKAQFEKAVIEKAWNDDEFKKELFSNPNSAVQNAFGLNTNRLKITIIVTEPNELIISIPPNPEFAGELTDEILDNIVGGIATENTNTGTNIYTQLFC